MRIKWSPDAIEDIENIIDYIAMDNPKAAYDVSNKLENRVMLLATQPYSGRIGRIHGTHELVVSPNYIIPYRVLSNEVHILNVLHTARKWPETL